MPALRRSPGAGLSLGLRAPGILSMESPMRAMTSATLDGGTPMISSTIFSSISRSFLVGFRMVTSWLTSLIKTLSFENLEVFFFLVLDGEAGEGTDDVIGFIAGIFENGQAHGGAVAADEG